MTNEELNQHINELRKQKNAVILAHNYQVPEIQDSADYVCDSLGLAQQASKTVADVNVFCGVHFMAETAKIINPTKKVVLPDLAASCSLAESCTAADFKPFVEAHPNHVVVSYINCSAEIKALSDFICTSSNAVKIVNSIPNDKDIIFAPDARFIAHPESEEQILKVASYVGSTSGMINFVKNDSAQKFIVGTEAGLLYQMQKEVPEKILIAAPTVEDNTCSCSECGFMKLNTLEKLYLCLKNETAEINVPKAIRERAMLPIKRMLNLSK